MPCRPGLALDASFHGECSRTRPTGSVGSQKKELKVKFNSFFDQISLLPNLHASEQLKKCFLLHYFLDTVLKDPIINDINSNSIPESVIMRLFDSPVLGSLD